MPLSDMCSDADIQMNRAKDYLGETIDAVAKIIVECPEGCESLCEEDYYNLCSVLQDLIGVRERIKIL